MTDKKKLPQAPEDSLDAEAARRRLLLRGGLTAGGLAAFAAGYGETLARGAKGLVAGTSGTPTASATDRKSTRLNSSHLVISYAVFCLKKKKHTQSSMPVNPTPAPPRAPIRGASYQCTLPQPSWLSTPFASCFAPLTASARQRRAHEVC